MYMCVGVQKNESILVCWYLIQVSVSQDKAFFEQGLKLNFKREVRKIK
jgi:hypothetical protein